MDILTVDKLAEVLQESNVPLLTQVLRILGADRTTTILTAALPCEATGGMFTKDGTRRRTPGGIFFELVKDRATPQDRQRLFPRASVRKKQPQPQALTLDEVQVLVNTLPRGVAAVTLTLTGRPDVPAVQARPIYVAFRMQGKEPGSLPTGLPPVPGHAPIVWLVVIALRQWNQVKDSLAAQAGDKLIIAGYPVVASDGTHVLLAQSCVSMLQQRAQKAARQTDAPTA